MDAASDLYLDLMMKSLTDWLYDQFDVPVRVEGRDWPARAHTMIGLKRLANVRECVESVLADNIPGDLIETGVWRGGTTIFMRAILKVHGVTDRLVWVADSFAGFPPPDLARYPFDVGSHCTSSRSWRSRSSGCKTTFGDTACWTTRCDFSKAGSATRCRLRPSSGSRYCVWMVISMSRRSRRSRVSTTSYRPAGT